MTYILFVCSLHRSFIFIIFCCKIKSWAWSSLYFVCFPNKTFRMKKTNFFCSFELLSIHEHFSIISWICMGWGYNIKWNVYQGKSFFYSMLCNLVIFARYCHAVNLLSDHMFSLKWMYPTVQICSLFFCEN